jgi:hypothetical protein
MRTIKMFLVSALCIAALFGGRPAAAESGSPALSGPASCLPLAAQAPAPLFQAENGCFNLTYCPDDDYCWQLCSTATTAACVNNVCQFTLPGGGGSTGGSQCPEQRHCFDDYHCVYPGGIYGTCFNSVCVC